MKKSAVVLLACCWIWSCQTKKESAEWPEMDSFHMVMAESFHPYKDSANLEPARRLAPELVQQAEIWAKAPLPASVDNDQMHADLDGLRQDCQSLAELIQGGADDAAIGTALTALHEKFHGISEAWHGSHEKHH